MRQRDVSTRKSLPYLQDAVRCYAGQAAAVKETGPSYPAQQPVQSHRAKQKQADKEFFADLLTSAATKRDAKAYISRLKTADKLTSQDSLSQQLSSPRTSTTKPASLFGRSTAVDASPLFLQGSVAKFQALQDLSEIHVALVKISQLDKLDDVSVQGIAQTLAQLSRLSMAPVVVPDITVQDSFSQWKTKLTEQADRLVTAIDNASDTGGRRVDDILSCSADGQVSLALPSLLFRPLRRGRIPVVLPMGYSEESQQALQMSADTAILTLTKAFVQKSSSADSISSVSQAMEQPSVSLDRIIAIDRSGPIPSTKLTEDTHVFVNLEQEYHSLQEELRSSTDARVSPQHASNLRMLRKALQMLPGTASGLITTPQEASNSGQRQHTDQISSVGTRRHKNALIHNLLTDKPAYSASLPFGRLGTSIEASSGSSFIKNGMPLTLLPNPAAQEWTAEKQPWLKLTDSRIDLKKLVYLIDDSFDRKLDVDAYLERVNDRIAGVIIAGEYEGGAILTWETPPGIDEHDTSRLVPYLDKFAVLKTSQGAGGVADILFNAMVRDCFPNGVCWRSRKNNPVNKWYFERSRGTWKIPHMNWTMFWTTPGVTEDDQTFLDYHAVCRGVQPTWADDKKVQD